MTFQLREITNDDQPFLWEMLYEAIYIPEGVPVPDKSILNLPEISRYAAGWGRTGDFGFISYDSSGLTGAVWCRLFQSPNGAYGYVNDDTPELCIAVVPAMQGQGLGTFLMNKLLESLSSQGYKSVSLSVDPRNKAINLYRRLGFIVVDEYPDTVVMLWTIPHS